MASLLLQPAASRTWISRATAIAAITVGHMAIIALAMLTRGPRPDVQQAQSISVSLLTVQQDQTPPPLLRPRPVEIVLPDAVPTLINIDLPVEGPPIQIAVVATASAPAPSAPISPVSVGDTSEPILVTAVEYLQPPVANYPLAAKQARASGIVCIRALVETDGRVREVRVQRSSGHASLDKEASKSVLEAVFRPYMRDGRAHATLVDVPVDFSLKTRGARRDREPLPSLCSQLDVRGENHHAMRGHPEELGSLGTAALHVGE
ncbi:MAG: energy transducer TonB [Steroidobacteraceae bacterium]